MKNLILTLALVAGTSMAFGELPKEPSLIKTLTPFQEWPVLGGRAVGLLAQRDLHGICAINWTQSANPIPRPGETDWCAQQDQNTYWFNAEAKSSSVVYFPSRGEGVNFLRNWNIEGYFRGDAAQFLPSTPNPWGLQRSVHLAEVEANHGKGSPKENIHFVITDAKVLDGTSEFPLSPEAAVSSFLKNYAEGAQEAVVIEKDLKVAVNSQKAALPEVTKRLKEGGYDYKPQPAAGYLATWISGSKILRVTYYRRWEDNYSKMVWLPPFIKHQPPGAPGMPPQPRPRLYRAIFGAERAVTADFDANGNLLKVTPSSIQQYQLLDLQP